MQRSRGRNKRGILWVRKKASVGMHQPNEVGDMGKDLIRTLFAVQIFFNEMGNHQKILRRKVTHSKFFIFII